MEIDNEETKNKENKEKKSQIKSESNEENNNSPISKKSNDLDQKKEKDKDKSEIESYLSKKLGKIAPTLYIEYPKKNDMSPLLKLDLENITNILNKFGKINFIEIYHLICLVQYDTFLSAYSCLKYFEKINQNKEEKIICRWFEEKDEEIVIEDIFSKIKKLKPYEIVDNINKSMKEYYMKKEKNSEFSEIQDEDENTEKENILTDAISQLEYYSIFSLSQKAQKEFNELISMNKKYVSKIWNYLII